MRTISDRPKLIVFVAFAVTALFVMIGHSTVAANAPEVVQASECLVQPLAVADLVLLPTGTPDMQPTAEAPMVKGRPADAETVASVTEIVRLSVACANANDPMRSLALFSKGYLRRRFSGAGEDDLGHLIASLSRTPGPVTEAEMLSLVSISDVQELPDGRVVATVATSNSAESFVDFVVFVRESDVWMIDEALLGGPGGTPETGA